MNRYESFSDLPEVAPHGAVAECPTGQFKFIETVNGEAVGLWIPVDVADRIVGYVGGLRPGFDDVLDAMELAVTSAPRLAGKSYDAVFLDDLADAQLEAAREILGFGSSCRCEIVVDPEPERPKTEREKLLPDFSKWQKSRGFT